MAMKNDINVVPLIDIVLVLLIVFIIMVPGMQKSLPTVIPQVRKDIEPPKPDPNNPPLVLEMEYTRDRSDIIYAFNGNQKDLSEIVDDLVKYVGMQPAGVNMRKVFLSVDRDVSYKHVVLVMDQLRLVSERVKKETIESKKFAEGIDGGDTKVIVRLKRRPGDA
jgi:biopolymer transport protein ExbD